MRHLRSSQLVTGQSLILVIGKERTQGLWRMREPENRFRRLHRLLNARPHAHLFHVVYALNTLLCSELQLGRGAFQIGAVSIERQIDVAVESTYGRLVTPKKLPGSISHGAHLIAGAVHMHIQRWSRAAATFQAFKEHMRIYLELGEDTGMSAENFQCLYEATCSTLSQMEAQCAAMKCQLAGIEADIGIQRSLMAERDTRLNISIAQAAVRYSKLVRRIAFVTMVFLPGIFIATFLNMVFSMSKTVSRSICGPTRLFGYTLGPICH